MMVWISPKGSQWKIVLRKHELRKAFALTYLSISLCRQSFSVLVTWIYASLSIASFHDASATRCTETDATSAEQQKNITFTPQDTYPTKPLSVEHTL